MSGRAEEESASSEAHTTPTRASSRKDKRRINKIRDLPRRLSLSRESRPSPHAMSPMESSSPVRSKTLSESAAVSAGMGHRHTVSEDVRADEPGSEAAIPRRIVQWINRVANSSEESAVVESEETPLSIPTGPETNKHVQRRRHHRITRPVTTDTSNGVLSRLGDRLAQGRVPSLLWQMTTESLRPRAQGSDQGVWLLGMYHGPTETRPAPESTETSSTSTESGKEPSEGSSDTSEVRRRRAWRAALEHDVSSVVWCTYRSNFPPIAHDGYIGADEEAAAAAVSAATEELCSAPPEEEAPPASPQESTTQTLTRVLLHPGEVLYSSAATRDWLLQQLESRGWQLPGLLAQLPVATGVQSRQEHATPAVVASSLRAILGAVEHDVLFAVRPLAASVPIARLRDSLVSYLGGQSGLPGLWCFVSALYESVSSITRPSGLTTDAGWGCMLRTAQSMLANALLRVHFGRAWRMPPMADGKVQWRSADEHAKYARMLSFFLDDPSGACPFGIHRLAAEGKRLGVDVGAWFGPSTAASVLRNLAEGVQCGLAIVATNDGMVYLDEVRHAAEHDGVWARPVLILVAQRLGLDAVPAQYRAALKHTFTFPQSMGVAGGRPGSSLYFIGCQRDQLLYLDPHTSRPAIPFRHPPPSLRGVDVLPACKPQEKALLRGSSEEGRRKGGTARDGVNEEGVNANGAMDSAKHGTTNGTTAGAKESATDGTTDGAAASADKEDAARAVRANEVAKPAGPPSAAELLTSWYCHAYSTNELATYHCPNTHLMSLSMVDPSMLFGFLVRSESELGDFVERVQRLSAPLFGVAETRPTYDDVESEPEWADAV